MNEWKLAWLSPQATLSMGMSLNVDREMPTTTKPARAGQRFALQDETGGSCLQ